MLSLQKKWFSFDCIFFFCKKAKVRESVNFSKIFFIKNGKKWKTKVLHNICKYIHIDYGKCLYARYVLYCSIMAVYVNFIKKWQMECVRVRGIRCITINAHIYYIKIIDIWLDVTPTAILCKKWKLKNIFTIFINYAVLFIIFIF